MAMDVIVLCTSSFVYAGTDVVVVVVVIVVGVCGNSVIVSCISFLLTLRCLSRQLI